MRAFGVGGVGHCRRLLPVASGATEPLLERGEYLMNGIVAGGNCPDGPLEGRELAGGLVIKELEFTVVTPNITPHRDRHRNWSD